MREKGLGHQFGSVMLTFDEVDDLIRRLDARTLEVVGEVARADGGLTLTHVAKIYGVAPDRYLQLHPAWLEPINGLVKAIAGETYRPLIFFRNTGPAERASGLGDLKYEIDGPSQRLLQAVLTNGRQSCLRHS
jgi:hypothetical protein